MRLSIIIALLAAHARAGISFNKLINGISSFPVPVDIDNSLNYANNLAARQASPSGASGANQAYLNSVCSPNITNPNPIPPCISINTIQTECQPNGTSSLDFQASAQCLCNPPSSFFADWLGCRKCLQLHGGLSQQQYNLNAGLLAAASSSLCGPSPTTDFAAYFASATVASGVATGATTTSDAAPSQSAVSLYYTPSGSQGPGVITGSATAATASGSQAATGSASGSGGSGGSGGSAATTTGGSGGSAGSSTSSKGSSNMAIATGAPIVPALMALGGFAAAMV